MGINNTAAAQKIRNAYEHRLAEIAEGTKHIKSIRNPNPVAEAHANKSRDLQRHVHTARAHRDAQRELDALLAEQTAARKQFRLDTERKLLGVSRFDRDTQQRYLEAKRLTREAAGEWTSNASDAAAAQQRLADLQTDALLIGDTVLAKAIAATARERGWTGITEQHFDSHPKDREYLEELQSLDEADDPLNFPTMEYHLPNPLDNIADRVQIGAEYGIEVAFAGGIEAVADLPAADISNTPDPYPGYVH